MQSTQSAQEGEGDRVVAAECHQRGAVLAQLLRLGLDGRDRVAQVERVDCDVARVGDLLHAERVNVLRWVVRAQQLRRRANVARPESGAGAVTHPGIEGNAHDENVCPGYFVGSRESRKGLRSAVAGHPRRVYRSDDGWALFLRHDSTSLTR